MNLSEKLNAIDSYPFHMPGHKRNNDFQIPCAEIDITEIDGFDNLHNPTELLADMQKDLAEIYGFKKSIISVNGSTCCILAAVSALCRKGDKIIIARNCHKSVYNACFINNLEVVYIEPEYDYEFGVYTRINQSAVDEAVKENPDACAVVITSPTYEGFVSRITCPIPLIIDAAHGAHFGLCNYLPKRQEADIIIQSLHKTLPALTQTAVVHINNEKYYYQVKKYMDIFESSSPSYVLLSSVDRCIDFLKNRKSFFERYETLLYDFYSKAERLNNIKLLKNDDKSRIVVMSNLFSGVELADILRSKYNIEAEGATLNYIILISTVCDTAEGFKRLYNALEQTDKQNGSFTPYCQKPSIPEKVFNSYDIDCATPCDLNNCIDKISAEYVFAYPPGIPIIVPGEKISKATVEEINGLIVNGVNIISDSSLLPDKILVY
ncbi:MAG: aminotransferase class I/II-fold pyridoxal phosphate-dependent enzyme [Eubacterium sp.]